MRPSSRIPVAVIGGAALIAAVLALRPDANTPSAPATAQAATAATDPGALVPYLRFSGTGTVTVKPDLAVISVSAGGTAKTSRDALERATKKLEAVQAKLKALGVADDDLQTSGNYTYQDYDSKNWRAELSLTVKVRDINQAGKLLAEANAAGADSVSGPSFSVEDSHAAYAQALRKAIEDARAKAEAAAAQLGVRVTGVVSVDDQSGGGPILAYAADAAMEKSVGGAPTPVPINPGTQDVSATVSVVFNYAT